MSAPSSRVLEPLTRYEGLIHRHVRAMVRDPDLAEELTQETFLRALAARGSLRDGQAALGWLYRIATNVCLDHLRRRALPPEPLPEEELELAAARRRAAPSAGKALERAEMSECVQEYLGALSDDQRVALLLHDVHGLGNPEIAELVGCSLANAKIRVHRARRRLKELLAEGCAFSLDDRGVLVCDPKRA